MWEVNFTQNEIVMQNEWCVPHKNFLTETETMLIKIQKPFILHAIQQHSAYAILILQERIQ